VDLTTDGQSRLNLTVPPKTCCVWGPAGVSGGFTGHPRRTTQEFQMADDLGDSNSLSLGYGGKLVAGQYRTGGSIWAAAGSLVKIRVYADEARTVDLRVLRPNADGSKSSTQGGYDAHGAASAQTPLTLDFTAEREGYHQITAKLAQDGDAPVSAYIIVDYEAPAESTKF
jgi:alpha-amylase